MFKTMRVETFTGAAIRPFMAELARLRITVFKEYPYLYAGSVAYEEAYLQRYLECPDCLFVIVRDGDRVVGASTALPLVSEIDAFKTPFLDAGIKPDDVAYFGESVLLPDYRGKGFGKAFFDEREAFARQLGAPYTAFCAVDRDPADPRRPAGYRPLDAFWTRRGYVKQPEMQAHLSWKELDSAGEVENRLTFWLRSA